MTKTLAAAALALFAAAPVAAYHIDGNTATGAPNELGSADWRIPTGNLLILCESNGPSDDRNSYPTGPVPGQAGLCTTGRNDATGVSAPAAAPATTDWTALDLCNDTIWDRNNAAGPFLPGVAQPCALFNDVAFDLELGTMVCTVPDAETVVYNEWYAWMTYDGDGAYDATDDAAGAAHTGDGDIMGITPVPGTDKASAWHGHVATFIDVQSTTDTEGSAETYIPGTAFDPALGTQCTFLGSPSAGMPGPNAGIVTGTRGLNGL